MINVERDAAHLVAWQAKHPRGPYCILAHGATAALAAAKRTRRRCAQSTRPAMHTCARIRRRQNGGKPAHDAQHACARRKRGKRPRRFFSFFLEHFVGFGGMRCGAPCVARPRAERALLCAAPVRAVARRDAPHCFHRTLAAVAALECACASLKRPWRPPPPPCTQSTPSSADHPSLLRLVLALAPPRRSRVASQRPRPPSRSEMPHHPPQPPPMQRSDCIDVLVLRLALPHAVARLARSIHASAIPSSPDPYTSACALYIASIAFRADQIPQLPLSRLLDVADSQLPVPESVLNGDMSRQADLQPATVRVQPPSPPPASRLVHLSHTAFMVTAHVWRQLRFLVLRRLLHDHERVPRLAWLFFLVAKASLSSPADCSLTVHQAYNLLLACLMQSGLITADDPEHAIFRATGAVPSELQHYRRALQQLLHKRIRARLPFFPCTDTALEAHCDALDAAYSQQLTNIKHRLATDERIFLHAPQLVAVTTPPLSPPIRRRSSNPATTASALTPPRQLSSCQSPSASNPAPPSPERSPPPVANQAPSVDQGSTRPSTANKTLSQRSSPPSTPVHQRKRLLHDPDHSASTPRPRRRRRAADYAVTPSSARPPTPARRARARSALLTPLSSPTFSRYAVSTRPDALDALATVAAVTPHCATTLPTTPPSSSVPHTPLTDSSKSVRWIRNLTDKRPETQSESSLKCPLEQVPTSDCLRRITGGGRALQAIIDVGRRFSEALCDVLKDLNTAQYKREALAVYFAAMEGILAKEHRRLSRQPEKFSSNVLHNYILHKSFLTFAWETTVAAYGRRDLHVFTVAYRAFNVSPFELTKALDAFCTLVPQIPRCLVNHLIRCDARILEWMAWRHDSPLVRVLQAYSRDRLRQHQATDCSPLSAMDGDKQTDVEQASPVTPERERCKAGEKEGEHNCSREEVVVNSAPKLKDMERPERLYGDNDARARVLDFFYEKVFALAGTRTEELLRRLDLTNLRTPVWRSIKYALWCRWNLVINRHVDLIILCVIYGVAKVRHIQLQFRQIVWHYNRLDHTNDSTFLSNSPAVFRNISLDDFGYLLEDVPTEDEMQGATATATTPKGDIIRFYNEAFVPHMRDFILPMGVDAANGQGRPGEDSAGACEVVKEEKPGDGDDEEGLNELAKQASRRHGREREEMFEDLGRKLLQSPMRVMKTRRSPIRIGSIVVSPMSPSTRNMVLSRQNSVRRSGGEGVGVMTPGTRTLFAFGESPMRSTARGSTTVNGRRGGREERRRYVPLSFDGPVAFERSAAVRREVQEVIGRSGRAASEEMDMRSSGEESGSDEGGDREEMEMGV